MKRTPHILTMMVDNEFGVLTRITAQIRREGWNIKSLAVAESIDPAISRITLALECFDATLPTVLYRLSKLACVRTVTAFDEKAYACSELALAKIPVDQEKASHIVEKYQSRILGEENGAILLEVVGTPREIDEFIKEIEAYGDVLVARTGPITLER